MDFYIVVKPHSIMILGSCTYQLMNIQASTKEEHINTILALSGGPQIVVWKSCNWTNSRCDVTWQNEPLYDSQWMIVYIPPSKSYHNSSKGLMCIF
jgi:hypothetical protein